MLNEKFLGSIGFASSFFAVKCGITKPLNATNEMKLVVKVLAATKKFFGRGIDWSFGGGRGKERAKLEVTFEIMPFSVQRK